MRRFFYRALIALHPPRFRDRFGDEMLCVFDESGRGRTVRLFADGVLSLLRQWLLRSNLWKMAAGAAISSLLLLAWGNAMAHGVDVSLMRGNRWHQRLAMNPWLGEPRAPFSEAEFEREAAEAVSILAGIRKTEVRKQHSQRHDISHRAPNPSGSTPANKG
ncbi:MAG TPA: hypothetical protein VHY09_02705 [Candidatus Methylacidiphilales bacterium]|jgi:hypothetical protein|nr:hypothetical protein [Candidatus Methylacidiphilales bacterium]